jgi:hypothetical protein
LKSYWGFVEWNGWGMAGRPVKCFAVPAKC